ncbi:MAG: hypothetical protein ACP5K9_00590 [Candidatus Micrarchaeia archaeon]
MANVQKAKTEGRRNPAKQEQQQKERQQKEQQQREQRRNNETLGYIAAIAAIAIIVFLVYFVFSNYLTTSFSAFKGNFDSAPRVAIAVTYSNTTQLPYLINCLEKTAYMLALHGRKATTMDVFILNSTSCTYSITGIGGPANITTTQASKCLAVARSEPSIFLNYSVTNSTEITPYHMYVYGNNAYMQACGVASEFS